MNYIKPKYMIGTKIVVLGINTKVHGIMMSDGKMLYYVILKNGLSGYIKEVEIILANKKV